MTVSDLLTASQFIARSQHSTINARQIAILAVLHEAGSLGTAQLMRRVGVAKPSITRLTQNLAKRGLITVEPAKDKRFRVIALTDTGRAFVGFAAHTAPALAA